MCFLGGDESGSKNHFEELVESLTRRKKTGHELNHSTKTTFFLMSNKGEGKEREREIQDGRRLDQVDALTEKSWA